MTQSTSSASDSLSYYDFFEGAVGSVVLSYCTRDEIEQLGLPHSALYWDRQVKKEALAYKNGDAQSLQDGYDKSLVELFKAKGLSLGRIPELDLGENTKGYIYVSLNKMSDGSAIKRFKDQLGRVGLAIRLHAKLNIQVKLQDNNQYSRQVITIFQRYVGTNDWRYAGDFANYVCTVYADEHEPHIGHKMQLCERCPCWLENGFKKQIPFLNDILSHTHPALGLDGEVVQELPRKKPAPTPAPIKQTEQSQPQHTSTTSTQEPAKQAEQPLPQSSTATSQEPVRQVEQPQPQQTSTTPTQEPAKQAEQPLLQSSTATSQETARQMEQPQPQQTSTTSTQEEPVRQTEPTLTQNSTAPTQEPVPEVELPPADAVVPTAVEPEPIEEEAAEMPQREEGCCAWFCGILSSIWQAISSTLSGCWTHLFGN